MRIGSPVVIAPAPGALVWLAGLACSASLGHGAAHAQAWSEIELVPDGYVALAGEVAAPGEALLEQGSASAADVRRLYGPIPAEVGIAAFDRRADGALVLATAVPWLSPEGVLLADDRLHLVDPVPLAPPLLGPVEVRARIDAVAHFGGSLYLLSFESAILDGDEVVVEDEDLVVLDASANSLQLVFDASTFGVPPEADLDAVAWLPESTSLLVSFDLPVILGGELVRPSDVAHIEVDFAQWSIVYAGSERFAAWANHDVVALDATAVGVATGIFVDGLDGGTAGRWSQVIP
jgi:hypothetical protein